MKLSMRFKEYVDLMKNQSNMSLTVNRLTIPFGVAADVSQSEDLLIGHILDAMGEEFDPDDSVDFMDVAAFAYELGHDPAGNFLEEAPYIAYRMANESGIAGLQ
jgi:hypothetical protein